jgi:exonuclease SbcD
VLRAFGAHLAEHRGPRVLLAHAMVIGSRVSTGQPLVGCDFEIGVEDLALAGADAVALGHIHMPQAWGQAESELVAHVGPAPVIYPGSPRRTAFGEVEEKGYVIVSLASGPRDERGRVATGWERIATPCTPMVLAEGEYESAAGIRLDHGFVVSGAEVRLRYQVAADQRDAARAAAETLRADMLDRGAVDVKLEEVVIATSSARAPEVARARTVAEKLRAMWRARGDEPEPDRAERLLAHVGEIETEAA